MGERIARDLRIRGRVQGVFYRATLQREALARGVTGWVSNEYDGSVRAHVEGTADAVAGLVAWAREGPPHARVDAVDEADADPEGGADFQVR